MARRQFRWAMMFAAWLCVAPHHAARAADEQTLRVGVLNNPPYGFSGPHGLDGISIAAFRIIAARNHWHPDFILENTQDQLTTALITHQIDIGIGGLTPTIDLGLVVDYSDPNQIVPLALVVKDEGSGTRFAHIIGRAARMLVSVEMLALYAIGLGAVLIGGYIVRWLERRRNPDIFPPQLRDNVWWAAQTLIAHNCGSKLPDTERGRYLAIVLMLGGTVFTAEITAVLTTSLASSLQNTAPITGIGDIGSRRIATVGDSYAQDWLQQQLITTGSYRDVQDCVRAVEQGKAPGAVFDEVALRRVLATGDYPDLKIVGDTFGSHPHAYMLPKRSPYLAPLNAAMEELLTSPQWQALTQKWLEGEDQGSAPAGLP